MLENVNQFPTKFTKCQKFKNEFSQYTQNVKNNQVHKYKM